MTFPAVTISFRLPPKNKTDDPWDYIAKVYTVKFNSALFGLPVVGVPCDAVEGYSTNTLD